MVAALGRAAESMAFLLFIRLTGYYQFEKSYVKGLLTHYTRMLLLFGLAAVIPYLLSTINILKEYERSVVFKLGRLLPKDHGTGSGLYFLACL